MENEKSDNDKPKNSILDGFKKSWEVILLTVFGAICAMFIFLGYTDKMHVSIFIPVMLTLIGHAFLDWKKEKKKNFGALMILVIGTVVVSFIAQVGGVKTESKLNIYDFCIAQDSPENSFVNCVKDHNNKLGNANKFQVYSPKTDTQSDQAAITSK